MDGSSLIAPRAPGALLGAACLAAVLACVWPAAAGQRAAAPSSSGNPFEDRIVPLRIGDRLSSTEFRDQAGRPFRFEQLRGNVVLVAFIYTRCTDACPLITQKIGRLRAELGTGSYRYVEATIDPAHDTVDALARYARKYGASGSGWSLITGSEAALSSLWRSAGVAVIDDGRGELIHNDRLLLVAADGTLADVIDAAGWSQSAVAAGMKHLAGKAANPLARANLALTKAVAALCGSSYQTAAGVIDVVMALLVAGLGVAAFYWLGRRLFAQGA